MGPIIRVPEDVAHRLEEGTDLDEVVIDTPRAIDEPDLQLGATPGVFLVLTETSQHGFGRLVSMIAMSDYARSAPEPFELIVRDKDSLPHAFPSTVVNGQAIQDHLKLAYFGELGDRRPLFPGLGTEGF
jgi:hypothetical protein